MSQLFFKKLEFGLNITHINIIMNYSTRTIKRIMKDIHILEECRNDLEKSGIYFYYDESNLGKFYFIITGEEDTPYDKGIYPFKLKISKDPVNEYPFSPPIVKFILPNDGISRMNPNLYIDGKVCLSMINTWHGPGWRPTYTLDKIMLAIKALVLGEKYPLINEPGYELDSYSKINTIIVNKNNKTNEEIYYEKLKLYNICIEHQNFALAIIKMFLMKDEKDYKMFHKIINDFIIKNKNYYIEKLNKLINTYKNKFFIEPVYSMKIQNNYKKMLKIINEFN